MFEKIHIIIALVAALIITVVSIINNVSFFALCVSLIVTIVVFYILGLILKVTLVKILKTFDEEYRNNEDSAGVDVDDTVDSSEDSIDIFDDEG